MKGDEPDGAIERLVQDVRGGDISRRAFLQRAAAIGISASAAASLLSDAAWAAPDGKTSIVVGWPATPSRLNQQFDFGAAANEVNLNAGEQLSRWRLAAISKPAGALEPPFHRVSSSFQDIMEPRLAEDWKVDKSWRVFTIRLKSGIESHAGNELTAEDVRWNWAEWDFTSKAVGLFFAQVGSLSSPKNVRVIDRRTIQVRVDRTNPLFLANLNQVNRAIYDSKVLKAHKTGTDPVGNSWADKNDAGFGAYVVSDYEPGREWTLDRFNGYRFKKPVVTRIVNRQIPDGAQRLALLRAGAIDVARGLLPRELASLKGDSKIKVWNLKGVNQLQFFVNPSVKPFDSKLVRQALAWAVPYDAIVKNVLLGFGRRSRSPVPDFFPGSVPAWKYDYEPDRAKSLLRRAGFANGFTFTITYSADDPLAEPVLNIMRTAFGNIGIKANLRALPRGAYTASLFGKKNTAALEQNAPYTPDPYFLLSWYTTNSGLNYYNHRDRVYDRMVDRGLSIVNWPKRMQYYERVQEYLAENGHVIPIAFTGFNVATTAGFRGVNDYLESMLWAPIRT